MSDLNNLSPNLKVYDAYGITDLGGTFAVRNNSEQNFEMRKDCSIVEDEPMTSTPAIGTVDKELDEPMKPMNKFSSGDQVRLDINNQMEFIGRKAEIIKKGEKVYYASDIERTIQRSSIVERAIVQYEKGKLKISAIIKNKDYFVTNEYIKEVQDNLRKEHSLYLTTEEIEIKVVTEISQTISGKLVRGEYA